jgi:hypothetical protein
MTPAASWTHNVKEVSTMGPAPTGSAGEPQRRQQDEESRRTEVIQLRVSPAEKAEIERRATADHRPVSEYVRWRALTD